MKKYLSLALVAAFALPTLGFATVIATASPEEISELQNKYFADHGNYLQVQADGALSSDKEGTAAGELGKNLPAGAVVDVYESPEGKGYQVKYTKNGVFYSEGHGPEATSRTYSYPVATSTATSS